MKAQYTKVCKKNDFFETVRAFRTIFFCRQPNIYQNQGKDIRRYIYRFNYILIQYQAMSGQEKKHFNFPKRDELIEQIKELDDDIEHVSLNLIKCDFNATEKDVEKAFPQFTFIKVKNYNPGSFEVVFEMKIDAINFIRNCFDRKILARRFFIKLGRQHKEIIEDWACVGFVPKKFNNQKHHNKHHQKDRKPHQKDEQKQEKEGEQKQKSVQKPKQENAQKKQAPKKSIPVTAHEKKHENRPQKQNTGPKQEKRQKKNKEEPKEEPEATKQQQTKEEEDEGWIHVGKVKK